MQERLRSQLIQANPDDHFNFIPDGSPIGIYCKTDTKELVLPPGLSSEKFEYLQDAYLSNAFENISPLKRQVILTYFSSGHNFRSLGKEVNLSQAVVNYHLSTGQKKVWENMPDQIKERHSYEVAMQFKNKYALRRGRPLSQEQKDLLRQLGKDRYSDADKERIRSKAQSEITDETRERSRQAALEQQARYRAKFVGGTTAETISPRKPAKPSRTAATETKKPAKPKTEPTLTPKRKPAAEMVSTPLPAAPTEIIPVPEVKPKTKLEIAKETLEYVLSDQFPQEISVYFKDNPRKKHEWKSFMSTINPNWPYFSYRAGKIWYERDPRDKEDKGFKYELTSSLLDTIWEGAGQLYQDRQNIINFSMLTPLRIESLLRRHMNS